MKKSCALWFLMLSCAAAPAPVKTAPPAPATPTASSEQQPPPKAAKLPEPAAVPPPPPECAELSSPTPKANSAATDTCSNTGTTAEQLARAIEISAPVARDRELHCLEARWPEGAPLVRVLRADLGPVQCADALATPYLESPPRPLDPSEESALLGLLIAGRLSRLVGPPPVLSPPFDKPRFSEFFERELKPWMVSQALAIGELSMQASKLKGYGKAIGAIEAGLADLRFVRAVRAVPLPSELSADPEVKNTYDAALDEALEPRKARGRDAALVGLRILSELGAARDPRIDRARGLLGELYGGRRIDALDRLLLPELPPLRPTSVEARLAASLPTFYSGRLLANAANLKSPDVVRALAERGVPANTFAQLDASSLGRDGTFAYGLVEVRRGITHFAAPAFAHAQAILGDRPAGDAERLLAALARALANAPRDAAELMLSRPRLPGPLGDLGALDALAAGAGPFAGHAEFDAAYLRSLTPSENDPVFWSDLAARFERAERKLKKPADRALARELGDAARETAKALLGKP
jgi:hypothetical protein